MEPAPLDLVEQVERRHRILVGLAGRSDDQRATGNQLFRFRISSPLSTMCGQSLMSNGSALPAMIWRAIAHRAGLDADERRQRATLRMRADRFEPNRTAIEQHLAQLARSRSGIDQRRRDGRVRQRDLLDAGMVDDAAVEIEQLGAVRDEERQPASSVRHTNMSSVASEI